MKVREKRMNKTKQDYLQFVKKYSAITLLLFFVLLNSLFTPNFFRIGNLKDRKSVV